MRPLLLQVGVCVCVVLRTEVSWLIIHLTDSCISFHCRLDWPVRTLSFSHDGKMLASASEDHFIDICEVETGQSNESQRFIHDWRFRFSHKHRTHLSHALQERSCGRFSATLRPSPSPGTRRGRCWPTPATTRTASTTTTGRRAPSNCSASPMTPEAELLLVKTP